MRWGTHDGIPLGILQRILLDVAKKNSGNPAGRAFKIKILRTLRFLSVNSISVNKQTMKEIKGNKVVQRSEAELT